MINFVKYLMDAGEKMSDISDETNDPTLVLNTDQSTRKK